MDDEFVYDEDRLTGRMLTPDERERLRRDLKEAAEFARKYYHEHGHKKPRH